MTKIFIVLSKTASFKQELEEMSCSKFYGEGRIFLYISYKEGTLDIKMNNYILRR